MLLAQRRCSSQFHHKKAGREVQHLGRRHEVRVAEADSASPSVYDTAGPTTPPLHPGICGPRVEIARDVG